VKEKVMEKGQVKWVDQIRGMGVIAEKKKGDDLLFYCGSIGAQKCKPPREGDSVQFKIVSEGKMVQGINISLLSMELLSKWS
jgi:cold shock CspA family protein